MKIPELKMSGTGLIAEFPGIPNGFPNQDDVDLYNTRKSYAVIESLDLMSNISQLANWFSKIKKPNKHCSGNQSVIAGVRILTPIPILIFK